jgi:tRNA G18 (ribose-2'-O)-methylase SpoU
MAQLVPVDDPGDPRLADFVRLRDVALRRSIEAEHGLFLAEGEKVIRRAVGAGLTVRSFLLSPRWLPALSDVLAAAGDVPCYLAGEPLVERLTGFHVHRGALASLARPALPGLDAVLQGAQNVVVLEDVVDHTNVGAVFRCAAALGMDAVLLSPRCADPLYRRSVKVAMGAVFSVPWTRLPDWYDGLELLRRRGFRLLALSPERGAAPLETALGAARSALVFGSEGHGLSQRWLAGCDARVGIPMAAGVDSLNVSAAAAIACYLLQRSAAERSPEQTP